ncbi:hypothetical protein K9L16_04365 [Candidatus Pacearchaeota archaeon]|nr:hypothetical protein [Candidatus Pacearchaeota archaeon]
MKKYKQYIICSIIIILSLFIFGCGGKEIQPITIPKANFEKTEKFVIEEYINKPERPNLQTYDELFNEEQDPEKIHYFVFDKYEFAKIVALSKAFDGQKEMINQLSVIINLKIDEINSLKELIVSKEILAEHIAVLYINEQNIRKEENQTYKIQRLTDKVFMFIQSGVIVALALAL